MKKFWIATVGLLYVVLLLFLPNSSVHAAPLPVPTTLPIPVPFVPQVLPTPFVPVPPRVPVPTKTIVVPGPTRTVVVPTQKTIIVRETKTVFVTQPAPTKTVTVPGPTKTIIQEKFTPKQNTIIKEIIRKQQVKFGVLGVVAGLLIAFAVLALVYVRAFRKGELHDAQILRRTL